MKKLFLLSALLIFACTGDDSSNDDDNSADPIIGVWTYYYGEYYDESTNSWIIEAEDTPGENIDSPYVQTFYESGELLFDFDNGGETFTGTWLNMGDNVYLINVNTAFLDGDFLETLEEESNNRILFYCTNNILRWDFGWGNNPDPENSQQYMSKQGYNYQNCNEAPYNAN